MKAVERVGVEKLKNNLSAYLRRVKRGVRVLITDRDQIIAELGIPRSDIAASARNPLLAEWIAAGQLRPAARRKRKMPASPVRLPDGTARRLLDADRDE